MLGLQYQPQLDSSELPITRLIAKVRAQLRQVATYLAIGVSTTMLDFVVFNALFLMFAPRQTLAVVTLTGFSTLGTSVNSYFGHRRWTFRNGERTRAQIWAFLGLNLATIGLSIILVGVFLGMLPHLFNASQSTIANASKMLALALSGCTAFLGNKFFVFRG